METFGDIIEQMEALVTGVIEESYYTQKIKAEKRRQYGKAKAIERGENKHTGYSIASNGWQLLDDKTIISIRGQNIEPGDSVGSVLNLGDGKWSGDIAGLGYFCEAIGRALIAVTSVEGGSSPVLFSTKQANRQVQLWYRGRTGEPKMAYTDTEVSVVSDKQMVLKIRLAFKTPYTYLYRSLIDKKMKFDIGEVGAKFTSIDYQQLNDQEKFRNNIKRIFGYDPLGKNKDDKLDLDVIKACVATAVSTAADVTLDEIRDGKVATGNGDEEEGLPSEEILKHLMRFYPNLLKKLTRIQPSDVKRVKFFTESINARGTQADEDAFKAALRGEEYRGVEKNKPILTFYVAVPK